MPSYVGPARLVVDGTVHDVAVNLQSFLDLSESPADRWRGVVDAGFVPPSDTDPRARRAEVHLPTGRRSWGSWRSAGWKVTGSFASRDDGAAWGMENDPEAVEQVPNEGADSPQTLVGIAFPDVFRAQEFLTATTRLAVNGKLQLKDAVFVTKNADGHTMVKETADLQTIPTAASGAFWASLFGLLIGGPVGWLAGAAIGAGAGAATAKAVDLGISDDWVDWFRQAVEPGNTILALLAEDLDREALTDELARFPTARLVYANVDDSWLERMHDALGHPVPPGE